MVKANGESNVDAVPYQPATFIYRPLITGIEQNVGSVQGGVLPKLTASAPAFNTTHAARNAVSLIQLSPLTMHVSQAVSMCCQTTDICHRHHHLQVLVAGVPCGLDTSTITPTSMAYKVPSLAGQLLGEFWQLPSGTYNMPEDIATYTDPGDTKLR